MSIIILGKLFAGGASLVAATLVMYHGTNWLLDVDVSVYGFTAGDVDGTAPSDPLKQEDNKSNFQCKLSIANSVAFDCYIDAVEWASGKNQVIVTYENARPDKTSKSEIANADIKAKDKVYKITAKKSQLEGWKTDGTKLEIIEFKEGVAESPKKFNALTRLISLIDKNIKGKTPVFVGKVESPAANTTLTTGQDYQCALVTEKEGKEPNNISSDKYKDCRVHSFDTGNSTSALSELTFNKSSFETANATTIKKDNYYVISFKDDKDISEFNSKRIVFVKKPTITETLTDHITFIDIHLAALANTNLLMISGPTQ